MEKGEIYRRRDEKILEIRDWRLGLEAESSHFMHYFVSLVKDIFENVKFIMTIREHLDWVESEFGKNIITREIKYLKN